MGGRGGVVEVGAEGSRGEAWGEGEGGTGGGGDGVGRLVNPCYGFAW